MSAAQAPARRARSSRHWPLLSAIVAIAVLAAIAYDQDLHVHHLSYANLGAELDEEELLRGEVSARGLAVAQEDVLGGHGRGLLGLAAAHGELGRLVAEPEALERLGRMPGAGRKLAKQLRISTEDIEELDRVIKNAQRAVKRVEEEALLPVEKLRATFEAILSGEKAAERAKKRQSGFVPKVVLRRP